MISFINKYKVAFIIFTLFSLLIIVLFSLTIGKDLELKAYDYRTLFRKKPASDEILIVNITPKSVELLGHVYGRWPWPRTAYKDLINKINSGNPKAIIVDFRLEVPDDKIKDADFFNYTKNISNLFFVGYLSQQQKYISDKKQIQLWTEFTSIPYLKMNYNNVLIDKTENDKESQNYLNFYNAAPLLKGVEESHKPIGIINGQVDDIDKTVRTHQPVYKYIFIAPNEVKNNYLFSLPLSVAYQITNKKGQVILEKGKLLFNNKVIPLTKDLTFYLNWRSRNNNSKHNINDNVEMTYNSISVIQLFSMKNDNNIFKDKIVIIGFSGAEANDFTKVPNNPRYMGAEILATAIDNLLNDNSFIQRAPLWLNILLSLIVIAVILYFFISLPLSKSYHTAIIYSFTIIILYIAFNTFAFSSLSLWFDLINPLFSFAVVLVYAISFRLLFEKDKRSVVENTFSKYVSPQVYQTLLKDYQNINLGAKRNEITILFSDIRGFTSLTESLEPEEISNYLNEYFTEMVKVILKHNGTIDKFMGDAIMAFFGAPIQYNDHAIQAAKAALEMVETLQKLNEKWNKTGRSNLNIGIGINTGISLVGNFGSPELMDYTCIGDPVNLASRLESLNKEENTNVIISAFTYQQIKDKVNVRIIGPRTVKGKLDSIVVYELLSLKE